MADYQVSAEPRTITGKKVKTLRNQDIIPGNIYGSGIDPISIQFVGKPLRAMFRAAGTSKLEFDVAVADKTYSVAVVELQRHATRGDFIHLDLQVVG